VSNLVGFKFRAINERLLDSLRNNYVYFASPDQLNDPFDCQVSVSDALNAASGASFGEKAEILSQIAAFQPVFDQIQNDITNFGVFSLAKSMVSSVMWSQYADEHRGVCLTYSFPEEFTVGVPNKIIGRAPVAYGNEPVTEWLIDNVDTFDENDPSEFAIALMKKLLTVKADDWKHEEEYRLIRTEPGPLDISTDYLTQVCFGLQTSDEDRELVETALSAAKSNAVRLNMTRSDLNFGLVAIEI
jgi:hypothetical protein